MTPNEKEIRRKWQQFVHEQSKTNLDNKILVKKEDISKIFSKMFG